MRSKFITLGLLLLCLASLNGCVNLPPSIEGFRPVAKPRTFVLEERLVVLQKPAPLAIKPAEVSLATGTYMEEKENDEGTLFHGPPNCVLFEHASGYRVATGGLWIPKDPSRLSRMYFYAYTDGRDYGDRASALAASKDTAPAFPPTGTTKQTVTVVPVGPGANSPSVQTGAAIGSGILSGFLAAEIRANRGKPAFLWEVHSPELSALREQLNKASRDY